MTTAILGRMSGSSTVPYRATAKRTKEYSPTIVPSDADTPTVNINSMVAYGDSAGKWRLVGNIALTRSASTWPTGTTFQIPGVTFHASSDQPATPHYQGTPAYRVLAKAGTDDMELTYASGAYSVFICSFDVALASEPTWAAANMESFGAAVHIDEATATVAGLLSYYEEAALSATIVGTAGNETVTGHATRIGNVVHILIDDFTAVADSTGVNLAAGYIPENLRPTNAVGAVYQGRDGATNYAACHLAVSTGGGIEFFQADGSSFAGAENCGFYRSVAISYIVD